MQYQFFFYDIEKLKEEKNEKTFKVFNKNGEIIDFLGAKIQTPPKLIVNFQSIDSVKTGLMQGVYMIYYFYYVSKVNTLQDKITAMKNNLNIAKGTKKISELQTQQTSALIDAQTEELKGKKDYSY